MKYRSDIDGLRALAIIAVLIYHMFPKLLPGGFVGVDIFFIISGFLIGSTIVKEYESGIFNFLKFYQRRLIRIIPLLLIVLFSTLIVGYFLLVPFDFSSLGRHIGAASTFSSNFLLIDEVDYFATAAELKPLLHLWSLGIEEQFYLILPLLIVVFGRNKNRSLIFLVLAIILSFVCSQFYLTKTPQDAFFRPESRFWELLLGVLLSRIVGLKFFETSLKKYYSLIGLVFCVIGMFFFTGKDPFPSYRALLPTVGAMLIILSGSEGLINKRIFTNPLIVFIGKISYSLYLWHWVVISFCQIIYNQKVPTSAMLIAGLVSILLSIVTFYGVENKLRKITEREKKIITIVSIIGLFTVYFLGRSIYKFKITQHFVADNVEKITKAAMSPLGFKGLLKDGKVTKLDYNNEVIYKRGKGPRVVVMAGDSHTEQYFARVESLVSLDDPNTTVYFVVKPTCYLLSNIHYEDEDMLECTKFYKNVLSFFDETKIDAYVMSGYFASIYHRRFDSYYIHDNKKFVVGKDSEARDYIIKDLAQTINKVTKKGGKSYIVSTIPLGEEFDPRNMFKRNWTYPFFEVNYKEFNKEAFLLKYKNLYEDFDKLHKLTGVEVINPIDYLCLDACEVVDEEGAPKYKDSNHFTNDFSKKHVKYLDHLFIPTHRNDN